MAYPRRVNIWLVNSIFYFALRQCIVHVPVRHKITNLLMPHDAGIIPVSAGSHYQGLVLRYSERAASAAKPLHIYIYIFAVEL